MGMESTSEAVVMRAAAFDLDENGGFGVLCSVPAPDTALRSAAQGLFFDACGDTPVAGRFYLATGGRFTEDNLARRVQGDVVFFQGHTVVFKDGVELDLPVGRLLAVYR